LGLGPPDTKTPRIIAYVNNHQVTKKCRLTSVSETFQNTTEPSLQKIFRIKLELN